MIPAEITKYSTPSMTSFLSERVVDFVIKRFPVVISKKTTSLYCGCKSAFIAIFVLPAFPTQTGRKTSQDCLCCQVIYVINCFSMKNYDFFCLGRGFYFFALSC